MKDKCINKIFFDWTVDIVLVEGIFTVGVFERGNYFWGKVFCVLSAKVEDESL